jgi:muramidase (phage lysozyme)
MANSTLAYRSSISVSNIKRSVSSFGKGIKRAQGSAISLSRSISQRNETKRQAISVRSGLFQRRREAVRRRDQEDIVEAGSVFGGIRRTQKVVMNSTKGFLGRILDYVGTLLVGWAVINLPMIIKMGEVLIGRIQKLTTVLSTFVTDTTQFLFGFGQLLDGVARNLISFDFVDSQGRINKAMQQMRTSFTKMEDSIFDAIRILTEPISFDFEEGTQPQEEPPTEPGVPPGPGTPPSGPGGSVGTREQRAMLDAIAFAEGTRDQPNKGYNTMFTFKQFSGYEDHPRKINRGGGYASDAAGRYQFLSTTWDRLAKKLGLKDFSPENQDKAAIELAREKGITQNILEKEGMSARVSRLLGTQWAAMSGSNLGQGTKSLSSIQKAYQKSLGSQQTTTTTTTTPPRTTTIPVGTDLTNVIGRGVPNIQITDAFGSRGGNHRGLDIAAPAGTYIALRLDSEVMFAGWQNPNDHKAGYGQVIDLWVPELGVQLRFGHCAGFLVTGGKVKAGRSFATVGSTGKSSGPHIHLEYTKQRNRSSGGSDGDPSPYVPYILLTNKANYSSFTVPGKGRVTPSLAQITIDQNKDIRTLKGEKKDNVIAVPLPSQQQRSKPAIMPMGGSGISIPADDGLNRFVTQKLLLDLAYT